tara:strand:- start:3011 stop:3280 length:270 start_codon:yes stop_codon:yes gene_type:complete
MESEDLKLLIDIKQIFQLSQSRGCWKLDELKNVGILYEGLCNIIKHYEEQAEKTQQEETRGPIETIIEQVEDNNEKKEEIEIEEMDEVD